MSWWVYLEDSDGNSVPVDSHEEGGTYALGGTPEAELNVTYNYSALFRSAGVRLRGDDANIDGHLGKDVIAILDKAVLQLGTARDDDYWKPTEGNAGHALNILLGWAKQHPEARFRVS